jgi:phage host-nuclease inhibitor protein Gam
VPNVQQLDVVNTAAVETGAVRFGAQPPGLYIRGDQARLLALDVAIVLDFIRCPRKGANAAALQTAIHELDKLAVLIQENVV